MSATTVIEMEIDIDGTSLSFFCTREHGMQLKEAATLLNVTTNVFVNKNSLAWI